MKRTVVIKIVVDDDEHYARTVAAMAEAAENVAKARVVDIAWTGAMTRESATHFSTFLPPGFTKPEALSEGIGTFAARRGRV